MLRTARIYFDVLLSEDALEEIRRQKAAAGRALDVAQASYDEGKLPVTDRNEVRARHDGIVARESMALDDLELRRAALFELTGIPAENLKRMPASAPLQPFDAGRLDQRLARAGENNALIALQSLAREIAAQEISKWNAAATPTVSLVAQAGGDRLSGNGGFGTSASVSSNNSVVSLQLSIPLYNGGMRSARGDEAVALAEKARFDVDATRKAVQLQTRSAWLGTTSGLTRIQAYERAVESARSRLDATETGYEVGAQNDARPTQRAGRPLPGVARAAAGQMPGAARSTDAGQGSRRTRCRGTARGQRQPDARLRTRRAKCSERAGPAHPLYTAATDFPRKAPSTTTAQRP